MPQQPGSPNSNDGNNAVETASAGLWQVCQQQPAQQHQHSTVLMAARELLLQRQQQQTHAQLSPQRLLQQLKQLQQDKRLVKPFEESRGDGREPKRVRTSSFTEVVATQQQQEQQQRYLQHQQPPPSQTLGASSSSGAAAAAETTPASLVAAALQIIMQANLMLLDAVERQASCERQVYYVYVGPCMLECIHACTVDTLIFPVCSIDA